MKKKVRGLENHTQIQQVAAEQLSDYAPALWHRCCLHGPGSCLPDDPRRALVEAATAPFSPVHLGFALHHLENRMPAAWLRAGLIEQWWQVWPKQAEDLGAGK